MHCNAQNFIMSGKSHVHVLSIVIRRPSQQRRVVLRRRKTVVGGKCALPSAFLCKNQSGGYQKVKKVYDCKNWLCIAATATYTNISAIKPDDDDDYIAKYSSAVAERPPDASCLSVVSFSSTGTSSAVLLVTSVSNLSLRTIKFFSLRFGVVLHAGYDNQDSLMRGGLCGKRTSTLTAINYCTVDCHC